MGINDHRQEAFRAFHFLIPLIRSQQPRPTGQSGLVPAFANKVLFICSVMGGSSVGAPKHPNHSFEIRARTPTTVQLTGLGNIFLPHPQVTRSLWHLSPDSTAIPPTAHSLQAPSHRTGQATTCGDKHTQLSQEQDSPHLCLTQRSTSPLPKRNPTQDLCFDKISFRDVILSVSKGAAPFPSQCL